MKKIIYLYICIMFITSKGVAQILGGGTDFSKAVIFNNNWLTSCPSAAQTLSNVAAFEPTVPLDACAPLPSTACVPSGTTMASDVWFSFFATKTTAKIVVAPTSAFNIVLQAFSGSTCPGLTTIGCANLLGNNGAETLDLTGLVPGQLYYFRIFGIGNNAGVRTGQYTFCGTTDLGTTALLPVKFIDFTVQEKNNSTTLNWSTTNELNNNYYEIEKSVDGNNFKKIGNVKSLNDFSQIKNYSYIDSTTKTPIAFYRIKQVDNDGTFMYSNILMHKSNVNTSGKLTIYPNPIQDVIKLKFNANANTVSVINILNNVGQVVYKQNIKITKGLNEMSFSKPAHLQKGIYNIKISTSLENYSGSIICL